MLQLECLICYVLYLGNAISKPHIEPIADTIINTGIIHTASGVAFWAKFCQKVIVKGLYYEFTGHLVSLVNYTAKSLSGLHD